MKALEGLDVRDDLVEFLDELVPEWRELESPAEIAKVMRARAMEQMDALLDLWNALGEIQEEE